LKEAAREDLDKYNSLFLHMAMMKWRFVISIIKLKSGGGTDMN
jgi:hypothetical protein